MPNRRESKQATHHDLVVEDCQRLLLDQLLTQDHVFRAETLIVGLNGFDFLLKLVCVVHWIIHGTAESLGKRALRFVQYLYVNCSEIHASFAAIPLHYRACCLNNIPVSWSQRKRRLVPRDWVVLDLTMSFA